MGASQRLIGLSLIYWGYLKPLLFAEQLLLSGAQLVHKQRDKDSVILANVWEIYRCKQNDYS